jgi:hypothetical protein
MHQTIELLTKAIAHKVDPHFKPRNYSHHVPALLRAYSGDVPLFASLISNPNALDLIEGHKKAYLGVRYGECVLAYDFDAWMLFTTTAEELLKELSRLTGLPLLS